MNTVFNRILLEAGAAAANASSNAHRSAAAKELAQIDVSGLALGSPAKSHLAMALREAVIGMGLLSDADARALAAAGIAALVKAARAEPDQKPPMPAPRPYWIEAAQ